MPRPVAAWRPGAVPGRHRCCRPHARRRRAPGRRLSPSSRRTIPGAGPSHAVRPGRAPHGLAAGAGGGAPGIRRRASGRPRAATGPAGAFEPVLSGGPRRLRHHRVGRAPAVVRRARSAPSGSQLPRRGAVARRGRGPAVAQSDGAGDDLLHAGELLVPRAGCGTAPGSTGPGSTSRPTSAAGSASPDPQTDSAAEAAWDTGGRGRAPVPADARPAAAPGRRALVFRVDAPSARATPGGTRCGSPAGTTGRGAAVLNLSGWFDEMYGPSGAVENFQGAGDALILGPWTHGVGPVQSSKAGERDFGADRGARLRRHGARLDGSPPQGRLDGARSPTVRVFVMGANRWRSADRWPWPGARADTMYLVGAGPHGNGGAGRLESNGSGQPKWGDRPRSDPAHPVTDPFDGRFGAHDYRALRPGPGIAVFETRAVPRADGDHRPGGDRAGGQRVGTGLRSLGPALRRGARRHGVEPLDSGHGRSSERAIGTAAPSGSWLSLVRPSGSGWTGW